MQDYRKFEVWKQSHKVVLDVYIKSKSFPREELYGLTSQTRRSAVSIGANIAEGCGRQSNSDFARFLHIAMGSASELEYHLLIARDLGYLIEKDFEALGGKVSLVKRMLSGLLKAVMSSKGLKK